MNISYNFINISSYQSVILREIQNGQTFCFKIGYKIKDSLAMFCIALGAFIRRKTVEFVVQVCNFTLVTTSPYGKSNDKCFDWAI